MRPNASKNMLNSRYLAPGLASLALFAVVGCGNNDQAVYAMPETVTQPVFDSHGNPPYVRVYPGISKSGDDRRSNAGYKNGDPLNISCVAEGRPVDSYIKGEEPSNKWLKLKEQYGGEDQYASLVYARLPKGLLSQLPACK